MARAKIDEASGCWLWVGSVDRQGYGKFKGPFSSLAHRSAYIEFVGPIPEGLEIDHLCRVRNCINPAHLEAVEHAVNVGRGDYVSNHRNGRKTHCKRGHVLAGDNVYIETYGGITMRKCRECRNMRQRVGYRRDQFSQKEVT